LVLRLGYGEALLAEDGYRAPASASPHVGAEPLALPVPGCVALPEGCWQVTTRVIARGELPIGWDANSDRYLAYLDADTLHAPLALRGRREGDWFRPLGLDRRQKLHSLMINLKIRREERDCAPLLVCGDEVAWVVGYRLDARYAVTPTTERVVVVRFE
jgi:tRNA(Ile)-lysidine synthase